jgi:hypothetical protein
MKNLLNKANQLLEAIEMGIYTKKQALNMIKNLAYQIELKYKLGSDNYISCMYPLYDAVEVTNKL